MQVEWYLGRSRSGANGGRSRSGGLVVSPGTVVSCRPRYSGLVVGPGMLVLW